MFKRIWVFGFLGLLFLLITGSVQAQQEDRHYFPETGHWVSGPFWVWYQEHPQSQDVLQQPITEAFTDPQTGYQVQYFVGGRMELRPGDAGPTQVVITPLGLYYHEVAPGIPLDYPIPDAACRFFVETGHRVCYEFLKGFDALGGLELLGYPVSEVEFQEEMLVQYFQLARLEWHPENPPGQQIVVTDLGVRYFRELGLDTALLRPNTAGNIIHPVTRLVVRPGVRYAVISSDVSQTLYVVVQDQIQQPVVGAQVTFRLITPTGETILYRLLPTDANGVTRYPFSLANMPPGLAQVIVTVEYQGLQATGRTAFRIWW